MMTKDWKEEMAQCPCGSRKDLRMDEKEVERSSWKRFQMVCGKCGMHTGWYRSPKVAKRNWNEGHLHRTPKGA